MAVQVLYDSDQQEAVLTCTTSGMAFGCVFRGADADLQAEDFLLWLQVDPRQFSDDELHDVYREWLDERLDARGRLKDEPRRMRVVA